MAGSQAASSQFPVTVAQQTPYMEGDTDDGKTLRVIHAALRGRYIIAAVVGTVLAVGAGSLAWFNTKPIFQATGYIRVKAYTPKILTDNEKSGQMPRYENYLLAQANTMRSSRVVDEAMQSDQWQQHSKDLSPQARDKFIGQLNVYAQPEVEQIVVQFQDVDPAVTQSATAAIISAYADLQGSIDRENDLARLAVLEELRTSYSSQLSQLRFQVEQVDRALGAQGIKAWHQAKVSQLADYEQQVELVKAELQTLRDLAQKRDQQGDNTGLEEQLIADASAQNPLIEETRAKLARMESELMLLTKRLGENHRAIQRSAEEIAYVEAELNRLIREQDQRGPLTDGGAVDIVTQRTEMATRRLDIATEQAAATRKELESLAEKLRQIDELRQQESELSGRLAQTRSRISQLNIESELSERVEILSDGEVGWKPINDSKRISRAGISSVIGFLSGFGIVGMIGLLGKRVNRSDILQMDIGDKRLLGLMPDLTEKVKNTDPSRTAQASVDHIRSLIHLGIDHDHGACLAITGPQSGSGKTTLAVTLALSFAESGSKVLLIDLDVVGGGLSHHVEAKRRKRLGEILADVAGVDRQQIEDIAKRIRGGGKQLGQYLVEEGLVEHTDVNAALDRQNDELGLRHALAGADFEHCTFPTRTQGLYVLPLRSGEDKEIGRVGPRAIQQLFTRAREAYDVVIVDTGPAPGSVETSLVTAAADATVIVVSRNDQRSDVKACTDFIESVGANIYGYVMNRAEDKDLRSSRISSSYSRVSNGVFDHSVFDSKNLHAAEKAEQNA